MDNLPSKKITVNALLQIIGIFDEQLKQPGGAINVEIKEGLAMEIKVIFNDAIKIINSMKGRGDG